MLQELTVEEMNQVSGGDQLGAVAGGLATLAGASALYALVPGPQQVFFAAAAGGFGTLAGAITLIDMV